jgi:putative ABC transport system permease protein
MTVVVRSMTDPRAVIGAVRRQVAALDRELPLYNVMTLDQYLAIGAAEPRFNTLLLASFAGLAMVLAAVGLYGVISYSAVQRSHEIGVRMALGAQRSDVLRLIIGQGMTLASAGVAIGLGGALGLTRALSSLLYGVKPSDPKTFVVVALVLSGVALAASCIPARRATKVDPMVALRYE